MRQTLKISQLCLILVLCLLMGACSRAPDIRGVEAQKADVLATVSSINSGEVHAEKVAELAFGAVGRVSELSVNLGDGVKAGQVLAALENTDLKSAVTMTTAELTRVQSLYKSKVSPQSEVDRAVEAHDRAVGAMEKSLIRAPFDGLIVEVNLEVGQLSQITAVIPKPLLRIIDVEPRYVRAEIDEIDLSKVKVGLPAEVKILASRREPYKATVRKIVPFISAMREQDRTSEVELDLDSEGQLLPVGASADVEIVVERRPAVLAVPSRTLLRQGAERFLFKYENGKARRIPVKLGIYNFDRAEILEGITAGDTVLFPSESVELTDGMKVNLIRTGW